MFFFWKSPLIFYFPEHKYGFNGADIKWTMAHYLFHFKKTDKVIMLELFISIFLFISSHPKRNTNLPLLYFMCSGHVSSIGIITFVSSGLEFILFFSFLTLFIPSILSLRSCPDEMVKRLIQHRSMVFRRSRKRFFPSHRTE